MADAPRNEGMGRPHGPSTPPTLEGLWHLLQGVVGGPPSDPTPSWDPSYLSREYAGPVDMSMIPTAANLDRFNAIKGALASGLRRTGRHGSEAIEALSYMGARYPNRMNTATGISPQVGEYKGAIDVPYDFLGVKVTNANNRNLPPGKAGPIVYNPEAIGSLHDLIGTFGHETQHGVDSVRRGYQYLQKGRTMQRLMEGLGLEHLYPYKAIPSEGRAYQAGDTAAQGYDKYQELLLNDPMLDAYRQAYRPSGSR